MDSLPASECVDTKPSESNVIPQFPHIDLDNSEVSQDVNACTSEYTDSPKSEGISFPLSICSFFDC